MTKFKLHTLANVAELVLKFYNYEILNECFWRDVAFFYVKQLRVNYCSVFLPVILSDCLRAHYKHHTRSVDFDILH